MLEIIMPALLFEDALYHQELRQQLTGPTFSHQSSSREMFEKCFSSRTSHEPVIQISTEEEWQMPQRTLLGKSSCFSRCAQETHSMVIFRKEPLAVQC